MDRAMHKSYAWLTLARRRIPHVANGVLQFPTLQPVAPISVYPRPLKRSNVGTHNVSHGRADPLQTLATASQTSAKLRMESCKAVQQLATTLAILSAAALTGSEFRGQRESTGACSPLLWGSLAAALIAAVSSVMLAFHFESRCHLPNKDMAVAWGPIALLDLSIGEFLAAGFLWYSARHGSSEYFRPVTTQLLVMTAGVIGLAAWLWRPSRWRGISHTRPSAKKR